jgi:hypothetical protein
MNDGVAPEKECLYAGGIALSVHTTNCIPRSDEPRKGCFVERFVDSSRLSCDRYRLNVVREFHHYQRQVPFTGNAPDRHDLKAHPRIGQCHAA